MTPGYKAHPAYSAGFDDGWRGLPRLQSDPAYLAGHACARDRKAVLTGDGPVHDFSFFIRSPERLPTAA